MTPEAREDRLLGVLCLTARTSISRLPPQTRGALLGEPTCAPVRDPPRSSVVRAVTVDAFSPALRGPRGMEDSACCDSEAPHHQDILPYFEA
jgi:hypothetical protein